MATNLGTAIGYLTLDITGFTRGIDEATRQIDRMGSGTASTLANMGTQISRVGTALTATVTAPVIGFGASILREGTTFEEAMTQVKNVANLGMSDINTFREAVRALGFQMTETGDDAESMYKTMYNYAVRQGSETRYTAEEVAKALYYMGLAGWDATKMMQGLRPVLDLAAATGEDLARVSDIVTDSMNALGIPIEELASYTNVLAEMTRSSNTTLDQAGEAFKYVAPLAGALGYSMQDVAIAIGEFANVGVKGSQAGTGLRQALNSLTNPSDKAKEVMDRLGWSMYDVTTGKAKPLMQVMTELRAMFGNIGEFDGETFNAFADYLDSVGKTEAFDAMSVREQLEMISEWASTAGVNGEKVVSQYQKVSDVIRLVGIRALPGMLGIIDATDDNFNTLATSVNNADEAYNGLGSAVGMADELMDTTQGSIYKLTSSISELRIQLFEFLQGPFQQVIDKLTDAVKWFNSLDNATQSNIMKWAGVAAAIGPVLLTVGKLMTAIANLSTGFKLAGISKDGFAKNVTGTLKPALQTGETAASKFAGAGGLGGIITKFLGIGSVAVGGVTAIGSFVDAWQKGHDIIHGLLIVIGTALAGLGAVLLGAPALITAIVAAVVAVVANLVLVLKDHWEEVKAGLAKAWETIKNFFTSIGEGIKSLASSIWNGLSSIFDGIGKWLGNIFTTVGNWLKNAWNGLSNWFSNLISSVSSWFENIFNTIGSVLSSLLGILKSVGASIIDGISNVFSMISNGVSKLASFFADIFSSLLNSVMSALSTIGNAIGSFVSNIVSTISNTISAIVGFIAGLAESIGSALMGVFNTIQSFFQSFIANLGGVLNSIGAWIGGVISELGGFIKSLWENIVSIVANFGSGIAEVLSTIGSGISSLVGTIGKGIGDFLTNIGSTIGNGIKGIVDKIADGFSGIWGQVVEIGRNIIMGIWEGIKAGAAWVVNGVGNVCGDILEGIKRFFKIGSPSKLMRDEVGRWLPAGIAEGFEDAAPEAEADINDSMDEMMNGISTDDAVFNLGISYSDLQSVMAASYTAFADAVETTEERLNASLDSMYEKMYSLTMLNQQLTDGIINDTGYGTAATTVNGTTNGINTTNNSTGNTFIFNSPKAIDEIEAARQMEKTQREMEEGFI